ncbi:unnamed protein product [Ectocarpus sp. CCAP 1310/34]|nr:unnamed protein product [Ectocarpus sp. CCAP 1310/34]
MPKGLSWLLRRRADPALPLRADGSWDTAVESVSISASSVEKRRCSLSISSADKNGDAMLLCVV